MKFFIRKSPSPSIIQGVPFMEEVNKRRPAFKDLRQSLRENRLWCGKVQSLCDGSLCRSCHLFPPEDMEATSLITTPSLTDHSCIGLTGNDEE
jgi:hypothetical protein